jgi:hypothetical protein
MPTMAAWLQLQQALFVELILMKLLLCPLMTVNAEQLFPGASINKLGWSMVALFCHQQHLRPLTI